MSEEYPEKEIREDKKTRPVRVRKKKKEKRNANWVLRFLILIFAILVLLGFSQYLSNLNLGVLSGGNTFLQGVNKVFDSSPNLNPFKGVNFWDDSGVVFENESNFLKFRQGENKDVLDSLSQIITLETGDDSKEEQEEIDSENVYQEIIQNENLFRDILRTISESDPEVGYEIEATYPQIKGLSGGNSASKNASQKVAAVVEDIIDRFKKDTLRNQEFESSLENATSELVIDYSISGLPKEDLTEPISIVLKPEVTTVYKNSDTIVPQELSSVEQSFSETVIVTVDPETGDLIELRGLDDKSFGEGVSDSIKAQLRSTIGGYICEQ